MSGALIEFFGENWSVAPGDEGRLREPGHQFEWVWLLHEYFRAAHDESVAPYAQRLFAFGAKFGIDSDGIVFDGIDATGTLVAGTKLLWPQTEYIKACAARAEWLNDPEARERIKTHLALIAKRFMRPDGANWHNQLARDATPIAPVTPARVLYHLFLCVAEADRLFSTTAS